MVDPVGPEEPQVLIQPRLTPPVPAEAAAFLVPRQVPPHLLLHPVSDVGEASTGVPVSEVVDPPPEDRVDLLDHPVHRLGTEGAEDHPDPLYQLRALFQLRSPQESPRTAAIADESKVESQEAETLPFLQVHGSALLFVDLDLELGQFLTEPLRHSTQQPFMK